MRDFLIGTAALGLLAESRAADDQQDGGSKRFWLRQHHD